MSHQDHRRQVTVMSTTPKRKCSFSSVSEFRYLADGGKTSRTFLFPLEAPSPATTPTDPYNTTSTVNNQSESKFLKSENFDKTQFLQHKFPIFSPALWHPSFRRFTAKSQISQRFHLNWVVIPGNRSFLNFDRVWRLIYQYKQPKFGQLWAARGLSQPRIEKKWIHRNHF